MKHSLAAIILMSCVVSVQAQTNDLWFTKVIAPTGQLTPRQICEFIESESIDLDPLGKGLNVLRHPGFDKWDGTGGITFSSNPIPFSLMLESVAEYHDGRAEVFDDVGVITWPQYRYAYIAIEGRCFDADSGDPITNFSVKGGSLCSPILAIQTNGYFVGGIQQRFDFFKSSTTTFTKFDVMEGIKQTFTFSAPGYNPLVVTNEIFPPGEPTARLRTYDIKLTRIDKIQGEQPVPGYPPQGVGSPDP